MTGSHELTKKWDIYEYRGIEIAVGSASAKEMFGHDAVEYYDIYCDTIHPAADLDHAIRLIDSMMDGYD